ncbi:MAG: lipoyl synthase [Thioalkalispiraceae bacterium]
MTDNETEVSPQPANPLKGASKTSRIPIKVVPREQPLKKPGWIRARAPNSPAVAKLKGVLREHNLYTVCEEAACPNIGECFEHGTATFMIMGNLCTRRCPFCDVAHGRPEPLDSEEPANLARTIADMQLRYVVITSVDRDDLRDGGAEHFAQCISAIRETCPETKIEILTPDFRGRMEKALPIITRQLPDVFNHNLETVPRLYKKARPGSDYQWSLDLIKNFKAQNPQIPTKSGLMLGLGETIDEVKAVMQDLHAHSCDMLTLGQYLQPSKHHLPVERYITPEEFKELEEYGYQSGFKNVASGPMVRSSYHADTQAKDINN